MKDATVGDTSNLVAKVDFVVSKAEVKKLDINKLVNVPTGLNNLKTKVDDLDIGQLKTVSINLKKFDETKKSDGVNKEIHNT